MSEKSLSYQNPEYSYIIILACKDSFMYSFCRYLLSPYSIPSLENIFIIYVVEREKIDYCFLIPHNLAPNYIYCLMLVPMCFLGPSFVSLAPVEAF